MFSRSDDDAPETREPLDSRETHGRREVRETRGGARGGVVRRHWGKLALGTLVVLPIVVIVAWTTIALAYTYSDGNRVGYNQKLSRKGWLCKTWEGEIALTAAPGVAPEIFRYSVRDDSVARAIQALEGQRVAIEYEQHKGLPTSCFGETEYFATGVQKVTP